MRRQSMISRQLALFACAIVALAAFSSARAAGPRPPKLPPLRVLSSTPAPEAIDASRTDPLVLNFSAPLNAQTVDMTRVMLRPESGVPQTLALSVTGAQLTITPSMQLAPATSYEVVVRSGVQGIGGEMPADDISLHFTTREASWRTAQVVDAVTSSSYFPSISSRGEAFAAVWRHENDSIALRRYVRRTGWSDVTILDRNTRAFVKDPQVFLDIEGTAHVIYDNNGQSLEYSRHTLDGGWSPVEQIVPPSIDRRIGPWRGVIDGGGNIIVVWTNITGASSGANIYDIRTMRYARNGGWSTPVLLSAANYFSVQPRLAVNADTGTAMAIWQESRYSGSAYYYQLWSKRYTTVGGWGVARRVDVGGTASAEDAQVALDTRGKAAVVYTRGGRVMVNTDSWTTGWGTPLQLDYMAGTSSGPQIAFDASGKAIATWIRRSAGGNYEIWRDSCAANLPPLNCWLEMQQVASATREFRDLQLAVDSRGSELLVVTDVTATSSSILAFRNVPGRGWARQTLDLYAGATSRSKPRLAFDETGSALAVWFGTYPDVLSIEASVFE